MGTEGGGGVGAKSSTAVTGGEKEISWHLEGYHGTFREVWVWVL